MAEDLKRFNIVPNKSLKIRFPDNIVDIDKYLNHFMRGIFDGDSSIQFRKMLIDINTLLV